MASAPPRDAWWIGPTLPLVAAAIAFANRTQNGLSGSTLPCPGATEPPLRTQSVRDSDSVTFSGLHKNSETLAIQAGERRSRKTAASAEQE